MGPLKAGAEIEDFLCVEYSEVSCSSKNPKNEEYTPTSGPYKATTFKTEGALATNSKYKGEEGKDCTCSD